MSKATLAGFRMIICFANVENSKSAERYPLNSVTRFDWLVNEFGSWMNTYSIADQSATQLGELFMQTGAPDIRLATSAQEGTAERASRLRALEADLQKNSRGDLRPEFKFC